MLTSRCKWPKKIPSEYICGFRIISASDRHHDLRHFNLENTKPTVPCFFLCALLGCHVVPGCTRPSMCPALGPPTLGITALTCRALLSKNEVFLTKALACHGSWELRWLQRDQQGSSTLGIDLLGGASELWLIRGSKQCYHTCQNYMQFETDFVLISRIFHVIFSGHSWLQLIENAESKSSDKWQGWETAAIVFCYFEIVLLLTYRGF